MRALIVFESMFGNAQTIARSISRGLATAMDVQTAEVGDAPTSISEEVDLLVVGGPNHQFGMTRPDSRRQAAEMTTRPLVSRGIGLREWIARVRGPAVAVPLVVFDTRLTHPRFLQHVDRTSRSVEKRLRDRGFRVVAPAEHFYVVDAIGPLRRGEGERAVRWGEELARTLLRLPPAADQG